MQPDEKIRLPNLVSFMNQMLRYHDPYADNHGVKTATIAVALAKASGYDEERIEFLRYSALLHDCGKLLVREEILNKQGRLSREDWENIKRHPAIGYEAALQLEIDPIVALTILQHHERWDGTGYPSGLKGEKILLPARILAIADVFDAAVSDRSYRKAMSVPDAINLFESGYKLFDPRLLDVFLRKVVNDGN